MPHCTRLLLAAALAATSLFAQSTTIRFNASGHSCGPDLQGAATTLTGVHRTTMTMTKGFRSEQALFVLGVQRVQVPIPFYGCEMFVIPLVPVVVPTDATGRALLVLDIPITLVGRIETQAAAFRLVPNELFASQLLTIEMQAR